MTLHYDVTSGSDDGVTFPHGSEVRFDCLPMFPIEEEEYAEDYYEDETDGKRRRRQTGSDESPVLRSWRIRCSDGVWTGSALNCDPETGRPLLEDEEEEQGSAGSTFNASCPFNPSVELESNLVAFHDDRELLSSDEGVENFEPGAELVFRCVDIGRFLRFPFS